MTRCTLTAILALLPLAGCAQLESVARNFSSDTSDAVERLYQKSAQDEPIIVEVSGPIALDLESFGGSIEIEVNPDLPHAIVTATRVATHGRLRRDEAEGSLDNVQYDVQLGQGSLGQQLTIRTWTSDPEAHYQRVMLHLEVPEVDGMTIRTHNGDVEAVGVYGMMDIRTDDGEVRILTESPLTEAIQIINDAGSINLRMRRESMGAIDAHAVRGNVFHVCPQGAWSTLPGTSHNTLKASLNDGTNPILLRAADGEIRIAVVESPTSVGFWIID